MTGFRFLADELDEARRNLNPAHYARLDALGCFKPAVRAIGPHYQPFGAMRVEACSTGLYEPADGKVGAPALIVSVCWPEPGFLSKRVWQTIDLIALKLDRPTNWLWRTGAAWALGGHLLEDWQGEPVKMVATPLDWLRAGGDAVCILDWSSRSPAWPLLRTVTTIETSDEVLGRRLLAAIDASAPRPAIKKINPMEAKRAA